ncbi:hypothetical protein CRM22_004056 [Opisthorchis felineus]|uniref:Uncharacterized protein n=1 Tax=Opisthorchis felineus TaxID=147828 RepID=A0A4S2LYB9_OPIFE|nr:hypothetical protein CRM22_004056 [Opisthorchis felineus]
MSQISEAPSATDNNDRQLKSSNPKTSSAISRVRPIPNFKRIHAQAAAKMESLPQYLERRCQARNETRPPFASPIFRGYMGAMRVGNLKDTINTRAPVPLSDMTNSNYCPAKVNFPRGSSLVESRKLGSQSSGQVKPTLPSKLYSNTFRGHHYIHRHAHR